MQGSRRFTLLYLKYAFYQAFKKIILVRKYSHHNNGGCYSTLSGCSHVIISEGFDDFIFNFIILCDKVWRVYIVFKRQNHGENIYWKQNSKTIIIWKKDINIQLTQLGTAADIIIDIHVQSNIDSVNSNYSLSQIYLFFSIPEPKKTANLLNNIDNIVTLFETYNTSPCLSVWVKYQNLIVHRHTFKLMYNICIHMT